MANRHKAQGGGREKQYGNKEVFASMSKGTRPGAIQKASGGRVDDKAVGKAAGGACAPARMDKKARGGGVSKSPFSSAAFKGG